MEQMFSVLSLTDRPTYQVWVLGIFTLKIQPCIKNNNRGNQIFKDFKCPSRPNRGTYMI